ncbi:MAG: aquaporin [Anaerolineales bacterium]|nr:aquaporin [Anaerolineales bacterium]
MFNSKVFLAEFIGAFALVFIVAGAGIAGAGLIGVALAYGLVLAVFWYAYGHISGAHINPAVTFGFALNGTLKWGQAISYWIAQFLGALCAAFLLKTFVGDISASATVGSLTTSQPIYAMVVEAILTFFLVNTFLHVTGTGKCDAFAGWAIGAAYTFAILAGSPLTGASLNPARTFGIALFSAPSLADTSTYVVYLFGPLIGATLAVVANNFFMGITEAAPVSVPEVKAVVKPAKKPASRNK